MAIWQCGNSFDASRDLVMTKSLDALICLFFVQDVYIREAKLLWEACGTYKLPGEDGRFCGSGLPKLIIKE